MVAVYAYQAVCVCVCTWCSQYSGCVSTNTWRKEKNSHFELIRMVSGGWQKERWMDNKKQTNGERESRIVEWKLNRAWVWVRARARARLYLMINIQIIWNLWMTKSVKCDTVLYSADIPELDDKRTNEFVLLCGATDRRDAAHHHSCGRMLSHLRCRLSVSVALSLPACLPTSFSDSFICLSFHLRNHYNHWRYSSFVPFGHCLPQDQSTKRSARWSRAIYHCITCTICCAYNKVFSIFFFYWN